MTAYTGFRDSADAEIDGGWRPADQLAGVNRGNTSSRTNSLENHGAM